jgi:hypothetical protein
MLRDIYRIRVPEYDVRMPASKQPDERLLRDVVSAGGKARAKALSPERRREIALAAAQTRWAEHDAKRPASARRQAAAKKRPQRKKAR